MFVYLEQVLRPPTNHEFLSLSWMADSSLDSLPNEGWLATSKDGGTISVTYTNANYYRFTTRKDKIHSYNLFTHNHKSKIIFVKWNEPLQKLASCDKSGVICLWTFKNYNWIVTFTYNCINEHPRRSIVNDLVWSHDGKSLLLCLSTGELLHIWGRRTNIVCTQVTFQCVTYAPDDSCLYAGTHDSKVAVLDINGIEPIRAENIYHGKNLPVVCLTWNCPKFHNETSTTPGNKSFTLAVGLQNGVVCLNDYNALTKCVVHTGFYNMCLEWDPTGELLAVAGSKMSNEGKSYDCHSFTNQLFIFSKQGHKLYHLVISLLPDDLIFLPASALQWAHTGKCLFISIGCYIHTFRILSQVNVPTLEQLCSIKLCTIIPCKQTVLSLTIPPSTKLEMCSLLHHTISSSIPMRNKKLLREYLCHPHLDQEQLNCTLTCVGNTYYTLFLESVGSLIPLLIAKRLSGVQSEFIIFDPNADNITSRHMNQNTEGVELSCDCTLCQVTKMKIYPQNTENGILGHIISNIWKTKYKMNLIASQFPTNVGEICYKPVLQWSPRQLRVTLLQTEYVKERQTLEEKEMHWKDFLSKTEIRQLEESMDEEVLYVDLAQPLKVKYMQYFPTAAFSIDYNSMLENCPHEPSWHRNTMLNCNDAVCNKCMNCATDKLHTLDHYHLHKIWCIYILSSKCCSLSNNNDDLYVDAIYNEIQCLTNISKENYNQERVMSTLRFYKKLWNIAWFTHPPLKCIDNRSRNEVYMIPDIDTLIPKENKTLKQGIIKYFYHMSPKRWLRQRKYTKSDAVNRVNKKAIVLSNKNPNWNSEHNSYEINGRGRITRESEKNCQFEYEGALALQFGRTGPSSFILDFTYPFSAVQAFAVALSSFTKGLK